MQINIYIYENAVMRLTFTLLKEYGKKTLIFRSFALDMDLMDPLTLKRANYPMHTP